MLAHGVIFFSFHFLLGQREGNSSYSRQLIPKAPTHSFGGTLFSPPESSYSTALRIAAPGKIYATAFCCAHNVTLAVLCAFFNFICFICLHPVAGLWSRRYRGRLGTRPSAQCAGARSAVDGRELAPPAGGNHGRTHGGIGGGKELERGGSRCRSRPITTAVSVAQQYYNVLLHMRSELFFFHVVRRCL